MRSTAGAPMPQHTHEIAPSTLLERYRDIRAQSLKLCAPLSPEDACVQSMEDASPAKWHLAHTTWFFETLVLEVLEANFEPFRRDYRVLFNSYYNSIGEQYHRPSRGLLTRPSLAQIIEYRAHVDHHLEQHLTNGVETNIGTIIELGLHHEQQHQELLLMDIKHLLSCNPLQPAYQDSYERFSSPECTFAWLEFAGGVREIGHGADGFAYDNEMPRHKILLHDHALANRPVTNADYLAFIDDGGYENPALWLADGWSTLQTKGWHAPQYWCRQDTDWMIFTLHGLRPLERQAPVCHVSYYEADAYARWAGARLPTEEEWENAAAPIEIRGNFVDDEHLMSRPASVSPAPSNGLLQLFGDVWEWTSSAYHAYPGFSPAEGALGEYNGKFMSGQMVMKGGACVTPRSHIRATYRNFFYPHMRWQFGGIRLARDAR